MRLLTVLGVAGCGPAVEPRAGAAAEPAGVVATPGPVKPGPPTPEPAAPDPGPPEPPIVTVPGADAEKDTLDDRTVVRAAEGPWTRRRVEGGGGSGGADGAEGLGALGTIGSGGGGGSGSGYGRGVAAAPSPARRAESAGVPASGPPPPDGAPAKSKSGGAAQPGAPLQAGSTDDNADYKGYLRFLADWTGREGVAGQFQPMDVQGRGFVRVLDGDGRPVPGARVEIGAAGSKGALWRATTYGDGRAPHYPRLLWATRTPEQYEVTATVAGESVTAPWDGTGELTLKTAKPRPDGPMTLEVLFLIDTTGSMGDEIDQIKASLLAVTSKAKARRADLVLRYGAVLYRDLNDDYLTMAHAFTEDLQAFDAALQSVTAAGGGDLPEALNQGLSRAVEGVQWQEDAAKLVFLICDAPPQMRVKGDVLYGDSAVRALGKGLRIHAVAASGLDPLGTLVLRQIAQLTRGRFIFIEYGGTQATAERHGVTGPVQGGNNLDDILLAQITAEIDGWGR